MNRSKKVEQFWAIDNPPILSKATQRNPIGANSNDDSEPGVLEVCSLFGQVSRTSNVLSYEARGEAVAVVVAFGMILVMVRVV